MNKKYYPWGGEFESLNDKGSVAVVLLNINYVPPDFIALYGPLKTENIGIEKIVANVISNPNIRYLVICGNDIKGHNSGKSLIALKENGIDKQHRIINSPGAIPYIENLNYEAIERFRNQIEIIDLLGITDKKKLDNVIEKLSAKPPPAFGEPYIAIRIIAESPIKLNDKRALHERIVMNYMGKVKRRYD